MAEPLLFEREGAVVSLTLNRPESRNPVSEPDMVEALEAACRRINADATVSAVILTGSGKAFSAGGNLKHMQARSGMFGGSPAELAQGYRHGIQRIPRALYELEVPSIAAVNGPAIGAGCDLALMCDIRIAAETASFAESFVKVGIIPGDGGAWLLPRAVGMSRASQMAFTGEAIDAAQALDWGLVSSVVPAERLLEEARDLAGRIAANPPQALRLTKRLLREGQRTGLDTLLELSAAMQPLMHATEDHREALQAFFDKRPPRFTGR